MRRFFSLVFLSVVLSACGGGGGGGDSVDNTMATISISAGDNQTGTVGSELATGLTVTVLNKSGQPVTGQVVNFVVTGGGGAVFSGSASSDNNGQARERWTLGRTAGAQKLEVRATPPGGAPAAYATFGATAKAGPAATLVQLSGNNQSGPLNQALPAPVKVVVKDAYGNAVSGATVKFTPGSNDQAGPAAATSDTAGEASTTWTLGAPAGTHAMTVSTAGASDVTFSADARAMNPPGIPAKFTIVSGDHQTVAQHTPLAAPVVILVTDDYGNPAQGAWVEIGAADNDPTFGGISLVTGADGTARWQGSFNVPGVQTMQTSVSGPAVGLPGRQAFSVTVTPGAAHPYDGHYQCQLTGGHLDASNFIIVDGAAPVSYNYAYGTLDEATGSLNVYQRLGLGDGYRLTGTLAITGQQTASGTGTFVEERPGFSGPLDSGTWTCTRRPF